MPAFPTVPALLYPHARCPSKLSLGNTRGCKLAEYFYGRRIDSSCAAWTASLPLLPPVFPLCLHTRSCVSQRHLGTKLLCCRVPLWMKAVLSPPIHPCCSRRLWAVSPAIGTACLLNPVVRICAHHTWPTDKQSRDLHVCLNVHAGVRVCYLGWWMDGAAALWSTRQHDFFH